MNDNHRTDQVRVDQAVSNYSALDSHLQTRLSASVTVPNAVTAAFAWVLSLAQSLFVKTSMQFMTKWEASASFG